MATKSDCPLPITIGGIEITQELIEALQNSRDLRPDATDFFAEQCLKLSTVDLDDVEVDRSIFFMFVDYHRILKELMRGQKGGDQ
jgi:hypothetical protein